MIEKLYKAVNLDINFHGGFPVIFGLNKLDIAMIALGFTFYTINRTSVAFEIFKVSGMKSESEPAAYFVVTLIQLLAALLSGMAIGYARNMELKANDYFFSIEKINWD